MLTFEVRINEGLIISGKVRRLEPLAGTDSWYNYHYAVMEREVPSDSGAVEERTVSGEILHNYSHGATTLVAKVLRAVERVEDE